VITRAPFSRDFTATLAALLVIGAVGLGAFLIIRPFLAAAIWAVMIVVVTWQPMLNMQRRLWNSRVLAILAMLLLVVLAFLVPLVLTVGTIVENAGEISATVRSMWPLGKPGVPRWVTELPFVGSRVAAAWQEFAAAGVEGLFARLEPYTGTLTTWFVVRAGSLGYLLVQFLLTLVLAAFLYANGEQSGSAALRVGRRLGGQRGEDLVRMAALAIRGVALGVGLTAVIQSVLGGIGLEIAGVPYAGVLTVVLFVLCLSQIGMLVVLIPAVIWVYWNGHPAWGTFLLVWSLIASLMDNVLRPILVRRTADLPLLLIFAGVIGGLIAYGLVGIFVGPVVLAVAYTLVLAWLEPDPERVLERR
jgi:predicted PurR-regulated permease PerM